MPRFRLCTAAAHGYFQPYRAVRPRMYSPCALRSLARGSRARRGIRIDGESRAIFGLRFRGLIQLVIGGPKSQVRAIAPVCQFDGFLERGKCAFVVAGGLKAETPGGRRRRELRFAAERICIFNCSARESLLIGKPPTEGRSLRFQRRIGSIFDRSPGGATHWLCPVRFNAGHIEE